MTPRLLLPALALLLASPALATNPDGPVGSMAVGFTYAGSYDWGRSFSALGVTFDGSEVGILNRDGSSMVLDLTIPVAPYATILWAYNRTSFEDRDRIEDPDLGTFVLTSDGDHHWIRFGARFYIPFNATAREALRAP